MADKLIKDIPSVAQVTDNIKLPASTGGATAETVTVGQLKEHIGSVNKGIIENNLTQRFNGFVDIVMPSIPQSTQDENAEVYFNRNNKLFVFKSGENYYANAPKRGDEYYNDGVKGIRKDKTYILNDELYVYDASGLKKVNGSGGGVSSKDTGRVINDIEGTLVTNALRKTPQILTEEEKKQVRSNLGIVSSGISVVRPSETTLALSPNTYNIWGEIAELNLTLKEALPSDEFIIEFMSGTTPTQLALPSSVKWIGGSPIKIEANKTYVVSIVNNHAVGGAF